ncbi:hypothetical protein C7I36_06555 [Zobellella taiwanensis]|uniref:Uncharacterized protein n=1 Tax=Zobellella taiwanensis TaxID=347535 RepID=A0A2P7R2Y6_9GAMM|nr:hypothetical protein [Zobellella taiwanensis]PSJ44556.1 hypothetical protein C7I36_06555 [Zobellella taiwanensis]
MDEREYRQLVAGLRRILDHYGVDYRRSPPSYNNDTLYDHQCRLILDEMARSWHRHYGYRPSPRLLQKALFAAEQSRRFSPPWYARWLRRLGWPCDHR